jgi:hypothetical protein
MNALTKSLQNYFKIDLFKKCIVHVLVVLFTYRVALNRSSKPTSDSSNKSVPLLYVLPIPVNMVNKTDSFAAPSWRALITSL